MTEIITHDLTAKGKLSGFDEGSSEIIFKFGNGASVEVRNPTQKMLISLQSIGLARLMGAKIDFVRNTVALGTPVKKQAPAATTR